MDFGTIISSIFDPQTAAYAMATLGLAVHFGYTGLLNFGQSAFMATGAYLFAITTATFNFPLWAALLAGLVGAAVFAALLGIPTLRLRADYLSMVTIAAAEIVRLFAETTEMTKWTGGLQGFSNNFQKTFFALNPIPPAPDGMYRIGPLTYSNTDLFTLIVSWILVILVALLIWGLMRSPWGRVVRGIREDEDAVRALGKNVFGYKMQALMLGGVIAGLGGIIYCMPSNLVSPDNFGTQMTFFLWTILFLGGAATVFGPIVGAMIFWVTMTATDGVVSLLSTSSFITMDPSQLGQVRFILVGIGLMLLVIFRPQGIFGKKAENYFNA